MSLNSPRRQFLQASSLGAIGMLGADFPWSKLPRVSAQDVQSKEIAVRLAPDIEPLVQLLEQTPRADILNVFTRKIHAGLSYQQLLAALQLAGVRNVQPRPSVGFKFHSVLVVNSAHLASVASPEDQRWLPILWALDYFKSAQEQDVRENNWTMSAVDESTVPSARHAEPMFVKAMEGWDESAADVAAASLARNVGATRVFDLFARYSIRDFRSIGHKVIFVANAWRALQTIGWRHAEPIVRSLAYALLNHEGAGNPSKSDEMADRPGRENLARLGEIRDAWLDGRVDQEATLEMLSSLREGSYQDASSTVVKLLNRGIAPQSIWDAMFASAGEMLMRQPAIVALHAVTTSNAMRFAFDNCSDDETRKLILLQNAAFLPLFRAETERRGDVGKQRIDELSPTNVDTNADSTLGEIFNAIGKSNTQAAAQTLGYLEAGGDPVPLMDAARLLIFQKGTDSHDYKFSAAVLEDFYHISPDWRNRFLAASVFKLRGSSDKNNQLIQKATDALKAV
jgi:hypothetical protein